MIKVRPTSKVRATPFLVLLLALATAFAASCNNLIKPSDAAITTDIKAKMFSDPSLKSANVDVSTRGGEVTLTGQVPDDAAPLAAYKIASETKGVSKVNDQMTVMAAQAAQASPAPAAEAAPAAAAPAREPSHKQARTKSRASHQTTDRSGQPPVTSAGSTPANAPTQPMASAAPAAPPPPQPRTVTVPSGTIITVRTIDSVDSSVNTAGQVFRASLDAPIVVDNSVIVPKGADAYMKLVSASSAGHFKGKSELTLALQSVVFQGKTYEVTTSDVNQSGSSRGKNSAEKIGGGAVLGALIGGLAGGGKGAAIGAAVGGGAGTGVQVFTKGKQVKIPSETRLDFTLQQPFDITYIPGRRSSRGANSASSDRPPSN